MGRRWTVGAMMVGVAVAAAVLAIVTTTARQAEEARRMELVAREAAQNAAASAARLEAAQRQAGVPGVAGPAEGGHELQRLRDENAALRERVRELEVKLEKAVATPHR